MHHFPKMFTNANDEECRKLLDLEIFKLKKIKHPERYQQFLEKFRDKVKKFAQKEYQLKLKS